TPAGSDPCTSRSLAFTRSITPRAFSPKRMTMMPPTTSPLPSSSATPRRMSGPMRTCATSRTRTGVPLCVARSETFSMSSIDFSDAWYGRKPIAQVPILKSAKLGEIVLSALVDECVFEHPAHAGRIRANDRIDALGKLSADALEILHDPAARPIHVRAVFEDH